jgi:Tfp pilus assembly protein PilN
MTVTPQEQVPPRRVRRGTVASLAIVAAVLAAAAGLFVALLLAERADTAEVNERTAGLERELDAGRDRITANESDVDTLEAERSELESTKLELRACADPAKASVLAAESGDDPGLDSAVQQMLAHCGR